MSSLQQYLQTDFRDDKREIEDVNKTLKLVLPLFQEFVFQENHWPYELSAKTELKNAGFSFSTSAMILFLLGTLHGKKSSGVLLPRIDIDIDEVRDNKKKYKEIYEKAMEKVVGESKTKFKKEFENVVNSSSFGFNDPFTSTWLLEHLIHDMDLPSSILDFRKRLVGVTKKRIQYLFKYPDSDALKWLPIDGMPPSATDHCFPLLRFIHLFRVLKIGKEWHPNDVLRNLREKVKPRLLARVHNQLSLHGISNSAFDSAELVFALEGVLLIDEDTRTIDNSLMERIFEVIKERQTASPYWRPLKPFVRTSRGTVLLPLSVEIGNSLLRICHMHRTDHKNCNLFSARLPLFRTYTKWLLTRMQRITVRKVKGGTMHPAAGWHSEHVSIPDIIHPWETSQVALYLFLYADLLQDHIAETSLDQANLTTTSFFGESQSRVTSKSKIEQNLKKFEPLHQFWPERHKCKHLAVYRQILDNFITPRLFPSDSGSHNRLYSILLYGPPGTGKTTVAEQLASALGTQLITVTPSNFITRGEAEVEARTKAIFEMLGQQRNAVILLDEIDRMILDRCSAEYSNQSETFQFMTPGMLTKLRNLRSRERYIFIIATNYEERIDEAAIRPGRIDIKLLLIPPDRIQRINILHSEFEKLRIPKKYIPTHDELSRYPVVNSTALATYGELSQLIQSVAHDFIASNRKGGKRQLRQLLIEHWDQAPSPSISLASYNSRLDCEQGTRKSPLKEFFMLTYLLCESDHTFIPNELEAIQTALMKYKDTPRAVQMNLNKLLSCDTVVNTLMTTFYGADTWSSSK